MDALRAMVQEHIGFPLEDLQAMDGNRLENLRQAHLRQRRYENAVKDFITVVLNTRMIQPDEDKIRVNLVRIAHLLEACIVHRVVNSSDDEFNRRGTSGIKPLASQIVQLIRRTANDWSATEEARSRWLTYHSDYQEPHQIAFEAIVRMARRKCETRKVMRFQSGRAEPTDEADRGRHPGFARHEGLAGGPGSLSLSLCGLAHAR